MRRLRWLGYAIFVLVPVCGLAREGKDSRDLATVRLIVLDDQGGEIRDAATVDDFTDVEGGENFARKFKDDTAPGVPYGVYRMRAHHDGFYSTYRVVTVAVPNVSVVLGLSLGDIINTNDDSPFWTLTGTITGVDSGNRPRYARLVGDFTGLVMDDTVSISGLTGKFCFAGWPRPGPGEIFVFSRTGVLAVEHVNVNGNVTVNIDLARRSKP